MKVYCIKDVAKKYKISERRARAIAKTRRVGKKQGRDWVFSDEDVEKMKPGDPWRPRAKRVK